MALMRIRQESVDHAVQRVARSQDSCVYEREFGQRDNTGRLLQDLRFHSKPPGTQLRLIIGGGAGDDAIEVFRITLRFHQALPSARGAAGPVRKARGAVIELGDDGFRLDCHLVDGSIREIDDFVRMSDCERRIPCRSVRPVSVDAVA